MADKQIPLLSPVLALAGPEELEVVQAGVSSRVSALQLGLYTLSLPGATLSFQAPLQKIGSAVSLTTVPVNLGGTGTTTLTANRLLVGHGTSPVGIIGAGSTGQILVGVTSGIPTWATLTNTVVTSFSAGTTGFTPTATSTGAVTLAGILQVDNGGTGANLGSTGGSGRVLMQTTVGGIVTVAQLAASNLTNGVTGTGAVVLAVSPALTGTPTAPTATPSTTNSTQIATTQFVQSALPTSLPPSGSATGDLTGTYPAPTIKSSVALGGSPTTTTQATATNNTTIATTAYVKANIALIPPNPTSLPPSGAAGGALTGTYPNPTLVGGPLTNYALTSSLPTSLPPNGAAGGGLTGSYPNPAIAPGTNGMVLTTTGGVAVWAPPAAGGGTVISVAVVSANGLAGTVASPTLAASITLTTTVNGMVKGNGTALSAATAGTDYVSPAGLTTALGAYLPLAGGTLTGGLTGTTATFSGNVNGAAGIFTSSVSAGAASTIDFTGRTKFSAPADGILLVSNSGVTSFTRMQLGGTTASFPAIKRNLAAINFRLADDTADAAITAGAASFTGTLTGAAASFSGNVTLGSTLNYGGVALAASVTGTGSMVLSISPTFTGDPKAPTPLTADNDTSIATTAFVKAQGYAPLASPAFTGTPTAPTATAATDSTQIATTAYVKDQNYAPLVSPVFTGDPQAVTQAVTDNDTSIATTAFVRLIVPPGVIMDYGGTSPPAGWLLCNGAVVSRTTYAALFTAISTTWNTGGEAVTDFRLPDLGGRVTAGRETTATRLTTGGSGISGSTLAAAGGAQTHILSTAQLAAHQHGTPDHVHSPTGGWFGLVNGGQSYGYLGGIEGNWVGIDAVNNSTGGIPGGPTLTAGAGSGSAHQNTQPTIIVNKIIKI